MKLMFLFMWAVILPVLMGAGARYCHMRDRTYDFAVKNGWRRVSDKDLKPTSEDAIHGTIAALVIVVLEIIAYFYFESVGFNVFDTKAVSLLVTLSILIVLAIIFYTPTIDGSLNEDDSITIHHTHIYHMHTPLLYTALVIIFIIEGMAMLISSTNQVKDVFDDMEYEVINEYDINLKAFNGALETNGEVHGGMYYIQGSIETDYVLYYMTDKGNGYDMIDHINYDKNRDDIHIGEKDETPRIHVKVYRKEYKTPKGEVWESNQYEQYTIYIPTQPFEGNLMSF